MNSIIKNDMDEVASRFPNIKKLKNKSVFITGATGLIARNFTYFLLNLNDEYKLNIKVIILVRNLEKAKDAFGDYFENKNLVVINQDVCDPIKYNGPIDYIFHAAGSASATAIKKNPVGIIRANTLGTINVLDLAREKKVKNIIFPSTREIYGKVEGIDRITEHDMGIMDPLDSRSCYPESKRLAETIFESYHNQYGVNYNILRIAHTYGPTMEIINDGRVMADFIGAVVNNKNIVLNSDGTAIRSFCYVSDAIEGILYVMLEGEPSQAYNLCNEKEPHMIREVAQKLIDLYPEKNIKLEFTNPSDEIKKGYISYKIVQLDTSKIEKLGWSPKIKLSEGLKRTIDYFDEQNKK